MKATIRDRRETGFGTPHNRKSGAATAKRERGNRSRRRRDSRALRTLVTAWETTRERGA